MKLFIKTAAGSRIEKVDFTTMDLVRLEAFARVGSVEAQQELDSRQIATPTTPAETEESLDR